MADKDTLNRVRRLLAGIADGSVEARKAAKQAIDLIDEKLAKSGRGEADVEYVVEDTVNGMALTERRLGGRAHPFRCPKSVYEALAKVMSESDRALPLDELVATVGEVLGDQPPDYQVRVPLRFWMHVEPPLVQRNRARYRATDAKKFANATRKLWATIMSG